MMSTSKIARLIATVGFCRAIFVCALFLLATHVVTFEQFIILALFGLTLDRISVHRTAARKLRARKRAD